MTDVGAKPPSRDPSGERVFLLTYEARPNELLEERDAIGGAFVSCWLLGKTLEHVKEQARRHLEATGWTTIAVLKEEAVAATSLSDEARKYYEQARQDGEVYVIQAFPPEVPDA
jgi:hypothetical protein